MIRVESLPFVDQAARYAQWWCAGHAEDVDPRRDAESLFRSHLAAADMLAALARYRFPEGAVLVPSLEDVARGALAAAADSYRGTGPFLPFAAPLVSRALLRAMGDPERAGRAVDRRGLPDRPWGGHRLLPAFPDGGNGHDGDGWGRSGMAPRTWGGDGDGAMWQDGAGWAGWERAGEPRALPGTGPRRRFVLLRPAVVAGVVVALCFALTSALIVAGHWKVGALESERARGELAFSRGQMTATLSLTSGAGRPRLTAFDVPLVEFSAWDSTLVVDGKPRSLWDHHFNYNVDVQDARAAVTIEADDGSYQMEQLIRLVGDRAEVEWYFVPLRRIGLVKLQVGHFNWFWVGAWREGNKVVVLAPELGREMLEDGVRPAEARIVEITVGKTPVKAGYAGTDLVNFFSTSYVLESPAVGERVLLAREVVRMGPVVALPSDGGRPLGRDRGPAIDRRSLPASYGRPDHVEPPPFQSDGSAGFHG
ncbi:MAG: hypothetical protein HY658_09375 [Actinobacteria bacterium]|nr:hypothetical protein [Actinomycetota bacterium]